jgi:ComF family protein
VVQHPGAVIRATALRWSRALLDVLYPPVCVGCGKPGMDWCETCDQSIRRLSRAVCIRCGSSLPINRSECTQCIDFPQNLHVRSYAYYEGPLLRAILHLKYRPNQRIAEVMGNWLANLAIQEGMDADIILTVPLSKNRLKQRGYNQVDLVADYMAKKLGIASDRRALRRIRETKSQVGLDPVHRRINVQDAFQADQRILKSRSVFLVDDLYTTGSTILACTASLLQVGVRKVYGLTIARAGNLMNKYR